MMIEKHFAHFPLKTTKKKTYKNKLKHAEISIIAQFVELLGLRLLLFLFALFHTNIYMFVCAGAHID